MVCDYRESIYISDPHVSPYPRLSFMNTQILKYSSSTLSFSILKNIYIQKCLYILGQAAKHSCSMHVYSFMVRPSHQQYKRWTKCLRSERKPPGGFLKDFWSHSNLWGNAPPAGRSVNTLLQ